MNEKEVTLLFKLAQEELGITKQEIVSKSRKAPYVNARRMLAAILKKHTKLKLWEIGKILGGVDHACVIHYLNTHKIFFEREYDFKKSYVEMEYKFTNNISTVETKLKHKLEQREKLNQEISKLRSLLKIKNETKWVWPVPSVEPQIPSKIEPGCFGYKRKFDIHTGVDIYCEPGSEIVSVEEGVVKNIETFTEDKASSPWRKETKAVWVVGKSGVVVYGEITPSVKIGQKLFPGDVLGTVETVLRNKKARPTTMLHLELYSGKMLETVWWNHGEKRPKHLLDPTSFLLNTRSFDNI